MEEFVTFVIGLGILVFVFTIGLLVGTSGRNDMFENCQRAGMTKYQDKFYRCNFEEVRKP